MPGHIGTGFRTNSLKVQTGDESDELNCPADHPGHERGSRRSARSPRRCRMTKSRPCSPETPQANSLLDAPTSAAQAAAIILDGVKADRWRILVRLDAQLMDRMVREDPGARLRGAVLRPLCGRGRLASGTLRRLFESWPCRGKVHQEIPMSIALGMTMPIADRARLWLSLAVFTAIVCAVVGAKRCPRKWTRSRNFPLPLCAANASSGSSLNKVELISSHALPDLPGKRVTIVRVTYGPGGFTPPHRHAGTVTAYITKGQIRSQLKGGPVEIFEVGQ